MASTIELEATSRPGVGKGAARQARRAGFVARFCERPFFFIRAATPQVLLDEVERIL